MAINQTALEGLKQRAQDYGNQLETEEATKNALIMPMIQVLGFEPFNPTEVVPEYTADIGTKKGEKVDYAIMIDGVPAILIECKKFGDTLSTDKMSQLMRYFNVTEAAVGCLTNGRVYKFFTDTEADNVMDDTPFLIVDLFNLNAAAASGLEQLTKSGFNGEAFKSSAARMRYIGETKSYLVQMLKEPSEEFVRVVAKSFFGGLMRQQKIEFFTPIIKAGMREFVNEQINNTLRRAVSVTEEADSDSDASSESEEHREDNRSSIITTAEEIEAFDLIKDIVGEGSERLSLRDNPNFCNVVLDDNRLYIPCRLRFNNPNRKQIGIYTGVKKVSREFKRYDIDSVSDIELYSEQIRHAFAALVAEKDG